MNNNAATQKTPVANNNANANTTVQPATSPSGNENRSALFKRSLVDYEGDSDEDDEESGEVTKRPRLS